MDTKVVSDAVSSISDDTAATDLTNRSGSGSIVTNGELFDDGELALLASSLFVDDGASSATPSSDGLESGDEGGDKGASSAVPSRNNHRSFSNLATSPVYGQHLDEEEARKMMPKNSDGLVYYCTIIPDVFCVNGKLKLRGLNKRDFNLETNEIKPRRPSLPLTISDLFSSLTKVSEDNGAYSRYIFNGILNGWPSLKVFELVGIDKKRSIGPLSAPDYLNSAGITWQHYWSMDREGKDGVAPTILDQNKIYRAKLRGPAWTSKGWSIDSPGFVFWFESQHSAGPRVLYGTNAVAEVEDANCTHIHMLSHRYAVAKETAKDRVTYHSVVLLEWDHGKYCTVVEGAYLNGIGGYQGKSNWYHDRDDKPNSLYRVLPSEMVSPWSTSAAEIRCYDVEAKNLSEFQDFVSQYEGPGKRFVDPRFTFSHPARLTYRSKSHIAQYCANYINRDTSYSELKRNCQTLAADLCSFLAGKRSVAPFHPVNRIEYHNRTHLFLYDSTMFEQRRTASLKGKVVR